MNEWSYSESERCPACDHRAVIPTAEAAGRYVARSGGRLRTVQCPVGNGWHLLDRLTRARRRRER
ncbi:MAG TPA: hypothetical protein VHC18_20180 [Amycolatopsis sp.]|nr:hypothetical protein [Amycolatopsis sp.]